MPETMAAMVLDQPGQALRLARVAIPLIGDHDVLIKVTPMERANDALRTLKAGGFDGAAVLVPPA